MKKTVQHFSKEYLEQCKAMSPQDIIRFLEDFKLLHASAAQQREHKSKLISIKIPEHLLRAFRAKAELENTPYQTQIKKLMERWLKQDT